MNESEQEELEKIKKNAWHILDKVRSGKSSERLSRKIQLLWKVWRKSGFEESEITGHRRTGGLLWQVFSWTEKCDSVCREIPAGTGSKPLQKYDTGVAVRKLFRRTIAWKTGTKTFKATGKRKNMGKFPKELRRNADRDGGRIIEKYRQRQ